MTCYSCNGALKQSTTTYFVDLKECMVIIKHVPCMECERCGEVFYSHKVAARLDEIIEQVRTLVTQIAVVEYTDSQAA
ncbi:MAG: type II toxin-antitoxin system MqsA family antitoxin [Ruminococcus sp.]|nr:type II toxin-antitoxin system MqsA family antitoxin [Ruminococcus sp.]